MGPQLPEIGLVELPPVIFTLRSRNRYHDVLIAKRPPLNQLRSLPMVTSAIKKRESCQSHANRLGRLKPDVEQAAAIQGT